MNSNVRRGMRQRNRAHNKTKQKKFPDYLKRYRDIRNKVISLVREAKNEYSFKLQNTLVDKTIPPGKWWRVDKSICQFKNRTTTSSPIKVFSRHWLFLFHLYLIKQYSLDRSPVTGKVPMWQPSLRERVGGTHLCTQHAFMNYMTVGRKSICHSNYGRPSDNIVYQLI